jgi:TonB family protein
MKLDFRKRFALALFGSFLLHAIFGGGLTLTGSPAKPRQSSTEVVLLSPEEIQKLQAQAQAVNKPMGQIVESDEKPLNDEIDPKAKYLSRNNQRVERETRAAKVGAFKNDAGQGGKPQPVSPAPEPVVESKQAQAKEPTDDKSKSAILTDENSEFEFGGEDMNDRAKPKTGLQAFAPTFRKLPTVPDPSRPGDGHEVSATDDHLKDVAPGMETMLSTREFMYYSYYNRIKDKLRQYWEPKIKEKFERIVRQGRTIASDGGNKITKVIIILNDKGTLIGVQVVSQSGVRDLDDAAIEAFRAAAPFPNPPKGIVEEDGTIKIRWDFVLEA